MLTLPVCSMITSEYNTTITTITTTTVVHPYRPSTNHPSPKCNFIMQKSRTKAQSQSHSTSHRHPTAGYLQIDPQIMDYTHTPHSTQHFEAHHGHDTNSFQAMLGDADADVDGGVEDARSVVDGDIDDMLVDQDEVEVEGQLGDIGTVEDHNLVGDVISNRMVDDTIGSERHKPDDDVMATARAAQEMISGAAIEGNSQWQWK
ncbi:hypothetical protein EYC84_008996 [Monilinia fructicola]|uniref:Uncharacterized protein n=1 Tax=Monilinia fructicola TaxID=38448 RepID=A0A5M9JF36_MONFR|nr:hypothetical protein EYC84_008996 [Monilinia fructicola]